MTCRWLNVVPKISSHSAGCTIRVSSSVRSCCSFCSSTMANVLMRLNVVPTRRQPCGARTRVIAGAVAALRTWSTCTAGHLSAGTGFANTGGLLGSLVQAGSRIVAEDVLERGVPGPLGYLGLQRGRRPHGLQHAVMHQR